MQSRPTWRDENGYLLYKSCKRNYHTGSEGLQKALRRLKKFPRDKEVRHTKRDCERFFRSGWFERLTDLNGEVLIRKLNEEVYAA